MNATPTDPLTKGAALLDSLNTKAVESRAKPVNDAQSDLAPLIPRALATADTLRAYRNQYGSRLDTLIARDWRALWGRVPERLTRDLQRTLMEARSLLSSGITELAQVPGRIRALNLRNSLPNEKKRIDWTVQNYESAPKAFAEKLERIEFLLSEVERWAALSGAPVEVQYLSVPEDKATATQAETE
jgi:hypothetical protein